MAFDQVPAVLKNKRISGLYNELLHIPTSGLADALQADDTLYFRPGGDGTDGTEDDSTAFPAPAAALSRAYELMDMGHTVRLLQGTTGLTPPFEYAIGGSTPLVAITGPLPNGGALIIEGDTATRSNVVLDQTGTGNCVSLSGVFGAVTLKGFTLKSAGNGTLEHAGSGRLILDDIDFTASGGTICSLQADNSYIEIPTGGAINFACDAAICLQSDSGYFIDSGQITISGNRTYTTVVDIRFGGFLYSANAWATTGTVAGIRALLATPGSRLLVGSANVETHIPGNSVIRVVPGTWASDGSKFISTVVAGTATFSAATTKAVTLPWTQQDAAYNVYFDSPEDNYFWATSKTTTGFTINAKTSTSAAVGWTVVRR